jgi:mRNA-degrading endonuclease RelE of RelBE toxin-antitoxin system
MNSADPLNMPGVKKLKGYDEPFYRLRIGNIRVIYKLDEANSVEVVDIDYRGNIY